MADMYDLISRRLKLLANANRFRIASRLVAGELSVGEIEAELSIRQPTLSREIARLRDGGVITPRRQGKAVFYQITDLDSIKLVTAIEAVTLGRDASPSHSFKGEEGRAPADFNPRPKFTVPLLARPAENENAGAVNAAS